MGSGCSNLTSTSPDKVIKFLKYLTIPSLIRFKGSEILLQERDR